MITKEEFGKEYNETVKFAKVFLAKGYQLEHPEFDSHLLKYIPEFPEIKPGDSIVGNIFLLKFPSYGLKVNTPDWLIYLLDICTGGQPGFVQMIYKELLDFINKSKFDNKGIEENYTITTEDFSNCFAVEFPILINPILYKRYEEMWDNQKIKEKTFPASDNRCDTAEYWLEVMKKKEG